MPVSARIEDYLEALFQLELTGRRLTVTALAEKLSLTKGTVATAVKKMEEAGLVSHAAYGDVFLTGEGRKIGWNVLMKHEGLTDFFYKILGIDPKTSEDIACMIEHSLDGRAAQRFFNLIDYLHEADLSEQSWMKELSAALDTPQTLPRPLTLWQGGRAKVCRLTGTAEITDRLAQSGIKNGKEIHGLSFDGENKKFLMETDEKTVEIDFSDAATVWVC